ncbi:hypothetical protein P7K49_016273 [Saguinus oedipus]|uniref:Uncharacterized protein n=1 Tax=Saguinus oedipus TaxID=9490 RepID=A0ABQ9VBK7_SAGOE|nr:hypothetical protein P7K49_016273 [Saguinus oedipus]
MLACFRGTYLDPVSGDLTVFNLTSSDEGKYEMESPSITGTNTFSLYVLDAPSLGPMMHLCLVQTVLDERLDIEHLPSPRPTCALTNGSIEVLCRISEHYKSHPELIDPSTSLLALAAPKVRALSSRCRLLPELQPNRRRRWVGVLAAQISR